MTGEGRDGAQERPGATGRDAQDADADAAGAGAAERAGAERAGAQGLATGRYVVMGVSGCGKSSVGAAVAEALGARFIEGDALHPAANLRKMARGEPLTDADRAPWLDAVGAALGAAGPPAVIACSALKRAYRDRIAARAGGPVTFLHLAGSREVIGARMQARRGHFMPPSLLDSQFAALEPPGADERAVTVDVDQPFERVVQAFLAALAKATSPPQRP